MRSSTQREARIVYESEVRYRVLVEHYSYLSFTRCSRSSTLPSKAAGELACREALAYKKSDLSKEAPTATSTSRRP